MTPITPLQNGASSSGIFRDSTKESPSEEEASASQANLDVGSHLLSDRHGIEDHLQVLKSDNEQLKIALELRNKEEVQHGQNSLRETSEKLTNFSIPEEEQHKTLEMAIERRNSNRQLSTHMNIAIAHQSLSEYRKSLAHYESALKIAKESGDRTKEGHLHDSIGVIYQTLGLPLRALDHHRRGLEIAIELNNLARESSHYRNMALVYQSLSDYSAALLCHKEALILSIELRDLKGIRSTCNALGNDYRTLGYHREALECYEEALEISIKTNDRKEAKTAYQEIGDTHLSLGNYRKSNYYYRKTLELVREIANREGCIDQGVDDSCQVLEFVTQDDCKQKARVSPEQIDRTRREFCSSTSSDRRESTTQQTDFYSSLHSKQPASHGVDDEIRASDSSFTCRDAAREEVSSSGKEVKMPPSEEERELNRIFNKIYLSLGQFEEGLMHQIKKFNLVNRATAPSYCSTRTNVEEKSKNTKELGERLNESKAQSSESRELKKKSFDKWSFVDRWRWLLTGFLLVVAGFMGFVMGRRIHLLEKNQLYSLGFWDRIKSHIRRFLSLR